MFEDLDEVAPNVVRKTGKAKNPAKSDPMGSMGCAKTDMPWIGLK